MVKEYRTRHMSNNLNIIADHKKILKSFRDAGGWWTLPHLRGPANQTDPPYSSVAQPSQTILSNLSQE